jgi:hypothetical protein
MPKPELQREINDGVSFWGYEQEGIFVCVMGMQDVRMSL